MRIAKLALTIAFAVVGLVLLANQRAAADGGIPLKALAGNYSDTAQGSLSVCVDGSKLPSFALIDCADAKAIAFPNNYLEAGEATRDEAGNTCATFTNVVATLPVDNTPPAVFVARHNVSTVTNYDASTGTGDGSTTTYAGGTCDGSTFDKTGATATGTSKFHFVASGHGRRIDFVVTSLIFYVTDTTGNFVGDFSISGSNLRQ